MKDKIIDLSHSLKYDFNIKDSQEVTQIYQNTQQIKDYISNIEKIYISSQIKTFLDKHPEITEWCIALEKSEYDDEGLDEGVHTDFNLKNQNTHTLLSQDYNNEYPEEYELNTSLHKEFNTILTEFKNELNINQTYYPEGIFENNEDGFQHFLENFLTKPIYQTAIIDYEQSSLDKHLPPSKKIKKSLKT